MMTIPVDRQVYALADEMEPAAREVPGERLVFEAQDALGGQVKTADDVLAELDFSRINPATGPVFVDGAEPGDTLVVRVVSIEPADSGAIVTGPGMGVLGDETERHATRILPVEDGAVVFDDLRLPARPMIGVIGVAPSEGSHPTGTAHRHGGNMDTKEIVEGCTVYCPVAQPGALLALGDVHAVMGDGEVLPCLAWHEASFATCGAKLVMCEAWRGTRRFRRGAAKHAGDSATMCGEARSTRL